MTDYNLKKTQGQQKMTQRLKELFSNAQFLAEVDKIKKVKDRKKQQTQFFSLAKNFDLQLDIGSPLFELFTGGNLDKDHLFDNLYEDVCQVYDEVDEYLNSAFPADYKIPPSQKPLKKLQLYAYPIHIGISTKASKRDLLDYINKRWEYIRDMLDYYEENPKGIRKRRKQVRDEFIWENRSLQAKDLANMVNEKFPNESLTYSDINSILYYLRRRKSEL